MLKKISLSSIAIIFLFSACKKEDLVDTSKNELVDITSEAQFDNEIKEGVSMAFYHASWCDKCAAQRPAVEAISTKAEYKSVFFCEVEYEDHKDLVKARKIDGFPTVVIYKDNVEMKKFTGQGNSEETLEAALKAAME